MTNTWKLALFGLISGVVSGSVFAIPPDFSSLNTLRGLVLFIPSLVPGIIFGLAIGIALGWGLKLYSVGNYNLIGWVVSSTVSCFVAIQVAKLIFNYIAFFGDHVFTMLTVAGFVGSLLMLTGFNFFLRNIALSDWALLLILGSVLGWGFYVSPLTPFFTMFIIWQTGMAGALGWVLDKKEKATISN